MALALLGGAMAAHAQAAQPVLQRGYDAGVSGATLAETALNTTNVNPNTFGLAFALPLDDSVYAQPLYVPNVAIPNQGTHNVVYVATMSDTLYAFDADVGGAPLWSVNFASLVGATPVWMVNFEFAGRTDIQGNLGILSTPVIDAITHIMYLVAGTLENNTLAYRLHAVDITNGAEPYGPGVLIAGSYGASTFDPRYQSQRVSLVLSDNQVVFGFGAIEGEASNPTYVGWMMAYDELTLQQSGIFATANNGNRGGGVWQSGRPPVVDSSGCVYVFVGNGFAGGYDGVNNFSESVLKLDPSQGLTLVDWFTAGNWSYLDANDLDLGASGPLLVPGTSLLAGGGKTGDLYVLDTTNLGKYDANDSQIVQKENITAGGAIRGGGVYWNRSSASGGPLFYNWGVGDVVKAYPFNGNTFAAAPSAQGTAVSTILKGGNLALSANGEQHGSGLLWAALRNGTVGELHAFDAENVSNELWNSGMNATRDGYGNYAKFVPPLIANGKVYVATFSNQVAVYGILPASYSYMASPTSLAFGSETTNVASAPMSITVTNTGTAPLPIASITLSGTTPGDFSQTNTCATSIGVGATCAISVVFTPTSTGSKTANLNVNAGGGAGTQSVSLSGTGVVPSYTVSPTSLAFGSVPVHVASTPISVTVTNTGAVALPITSITLSGTSPILFSQTNTCGTSVAIGANCMISVVFKPTATGSKVATLNVTGGGGAGTQTVALSGTGVVVPFTVSPKSVAFGSVPVHAASAPTLVTVTNSGIVSLSITSITLTGTIPVPFSQTNTCGASVGVGASCTISVVFDPTSAGSKTATLKVIAGGGAGTQNLTVSGTGVVASYTVSPTSVVFSNQARGTSSAAQSVTVTNAGNVTLPITSITLSGTAAGQFSQTNTCGTSVGVGATCTISVVFKPTSKGSKAATLKVTGGGGGGTQTVALSGTGT